MHRLMLNHYKQGIRMKLDKKILLLLGVITVGLLFSLGANAYLLKEVTDIRIILDSQFEVISNIMMMLGFELKH